MQELTKTAKNDQRRLTAVDFQDLARVPAAVEWFANLDNPRTRVLAWRADLEPTAWQGSGQRGRRAFYIGPPTEAY